MMKMIVLGLLMVLMMLPMLAVADNSLNEAVKEARRSGQVLSAKTRDGMHEIRVMTPQGTIRTVRKRATQVERNNPYSQRPFQSQDEPPFNRQKNSYNKPQNNNQPKRTFKPRPQQPRQNHKRPANNKPQPSRRRPQQRDPD